MSETMRLKILNKLTSVIGEEEATKLMENIPPFDWHKIATKDDFAALKEWTEAKFDAQSALMAAEFTNVRGEFAEQIGEVHKEIGGLRGEIGGLHKEIGGLRGEIGGVHKEIGGLHKEIGALHVAVSESSQKTSDKLDSMRRWVVGSVVAVVGAVVGSGVWLG